MFGGRLSRVRRCVGNRIVRRILDYWRRLYVIVVRVEVACGIGFSRRCKVLVKCDINKVVFDFV
jgi:hypothetical protein